MRNIPFQRFAGPVFAFGSYGLPSLTRIDRRLALALTIIGALVLLRAMGVIDDAAFVGLALGAGPTSLYQDLKREQAELAEEERGIIAAAEKRVETAVSGAGDTTTAKFVRGFTEDESERLTALGHRLAKIGADVGRLEEARGRERGEPAALRDGEPDIVGAPKPFGTFGEQLISVANQYMGTRQDERLTAVHQWGAAQGLNESVPAEGGFLVQPDYGTEILRDVYDTGILSSRCRRRPVSGSGFRGRAIDETSRATGSRYGGLQVYRAAEAGSYTASKPKFREIRMDLEKQIGLYYATDELLQDGPALEAEVRDWFTEEFGFAIDDEIVRGDGVAKPLGFLSAAALVSQAKEAAQAADTVNATNIQKMYARQPGQSLARAIWVMNQEVWPQLFAMNQANMPIFMPGGNLASAPFGQLLGKPIVISEVASALGDLGDINLVDLNKYLLIEKGGVLTAVSIHVQFLTGETAFRFTVRNNGQPIPNAAITPYKGASTLSPFVSLAERA